MNIQYYERLSADTQALVDKIEDSLLEPIKIEYQPDKKIFSCKYVQPNWCIFSPMLEDLPEGSIIHELLHIRRFGVDRVPRLEAGMEYPPQYDCYATLMDNEIEHIFILPEEIRRWPSRKGYWENVSCREINRIRKIKGVSGDVMGHSVLCYSQSKVAMLHKSVLSGWRNYFKSIRKSDFAEAEVEKIIAAESKKEIVGILCHLYGIPVGAIEYF